MDKFLTDIKKLRDNARKNMEKGAVTDSYKADVKQVLKVLNDVLATELVCVLRYKRHYYMAQGINSDSVKAEFLQHAGEEQQHADWIAERITQLGGEPDFSPNTLADRSASEYVEGKTLVDIIKKPDSRANRDPDLFGNIRWLGDGDPTTKILIQPINKVEEEHANDMLDLLPRWADDSAMTRRDHDRVRVFVKYTYGRKREIPGRKKCQPTQFSFGTALLIPKNSTRIPRPRQQLCRDIRSRFESPMGGTRYWKVRKSKERSCSSFRP